MGTTKCDEFTETFKRKRQEEHGAFEALGKFLSNEIQNPVVHSIHGHSRWREEVHWLCILVDVHDAIAKRLIVRMRFSWYN